MQGMKQIVFFDTEINPKTNEILDIGAIDTDGRQLHTKAPHAFSEFLTGYTYVGGHNILACDLKYMKCYIEKETESGEQVKYIDTLYLSPLLFPKKPYHKLLKDDKLQTDELSNPLDDSIKAMELFYDEVEAFHNLDDALKRIYYMLLKEEPGFAGFFDYLDVQDLVQPVESNDLIQLEENQEEHKSLVPSEESKEKHRLVVPSEENQEEHRYLVHPKELQEVYNPLSQTEELKTLIQETFQGKICENKAIDFMLHHHPVELAYVLAIIAVDERDSVTPPWVRMNYPIVDNYMRVLRNQPCEAGCAYCNARLDVRKKLKEIFHYDEFRTYNGEPLQEQAADAAVHNQSLLAIFPTGGGKSITFQLPALMAGETAAGLTVVISPLQSLMKDQVDNLSKLGIADAVTINGLLSSVERAEAFQRVADGIATLLYLSPESLRSRTVEKLLLSRNVVRFVIDEAHCFSAWGQDFRVDYLYIGDFIRRLQEKKNGQYQIPVSCFTATAKQKVIQDICDYFRQKLNLDLQIYATSAARTNLRYEVLYQKDDNEKYATLRRLIEKKACPTIVYVSRTKRTHELAEKLTEDGFTAKPFNGKMDSIEKVENQEDFIAGRVQIIVATSAFGMGVDKKDVGLVVHYDISDSLENYVQEAGRAGRDPALEAECYVLFHENDLDKHFILLNQTKLSLSEIQQVWRAVKNLTKTRSFVRRSPLEIARAAGWDENVRDVETRVKTAIAALENAGYLKREQNVPRVYATSILVKNMEEASERIRTSELFDERQEKNALQIMKMLIASRSRSKARTEEAESRIDYIADITGLEREVVIESVQLMREEQLLADSQDMSAYIKRTDATNKSLAVLMRYLALERLLIGALKDGEKEGKQVINLKEFNELAEQNQIKGVTVPVIKNLLYFWMIRGYIEKRYNTSNQIVEIIPKYSLEELTVKCSEREPVAHFIVKYLYEKAKELPVNKREETLVQFSVLELQENYEFEAQLYEHKKISSKDVEEALLYLSKIDAMTLEGGFLVLYNAMELRRLELNDRIQYKTEDYKQLNDYYKQKIQQIHIVGEYANLMVKNYEDALQFVSDYFNMDYRGFLQKYFKGNRIGEINRNITPEKYNQLFNTLSDVQREIIDDESSQYIVVAAGPGSGKTRVLVHKLAALVLLDDIKYEQLLMLTFSRAAATEFKRRMIELIGGAARFLEIKTFHSYSFDLLGKVGNLEQSDNIVQQAADQIRSREVEMGRVTKTVVVIDEAQDMDAHEFSLIQALMECNENMRVIAVGDDDQNIYEFRGSDSSYMRSLMEKEGAKKYELLDNYRSAEAIVDLANRFAAGIRNRLKYAPIQAVTKEAGIVKYFRHEGKNLEYPVVQNVLGNMTAKKSICVLTTTNDEALRVMGLFMQQGVPATLIQSNDGFQIYNLAELRLFMKLVKKNNETPIISDEVWDEAICKLRKQYARSTCLELCIRLLQEFAEVNERKYKSDLECFLRESELSDFYRGGMGEVVVSTIHKSKGREFDAVYMLLNQFSASSDEDRRRLYVGMTRAKSELYIHYTGKAFDSFADHIIYDQMNYPEPEELMLQLSFRDVVLDYFKKSDRMVLKLRSGDSLELWNSYLYADVEGSRIPMAKLSAAARRKLDTFAQQGYQVTAAKARFIVAWWDAQTEREYAVLLPDVWLKKEIS